MSEALYKIDSSTGPLPLRFVRNRKARRYILKITREGVARVTIPGGGSIKFALEFAASHKEWIEKQVAATRIEWGQGTLIFLRGEKFPLQLLLASAGEHSVSLGPYIWTGFNGGSIKAFVSGKLREIAAPELISRTFHLAECFGFELKKVTVRNQASRWGSCSTRKHISLNWKLIQTPDLVRDYIIVHELAHLKHMNHSRQFWTEVEKYCPQFQIAESWLKRNGKALR